MPFTNKMKVAEAILIMQAVTVATLFIFISDLNYSRQINRANQDSLIALTNETAQLLEQQGNISSAQRQALLSQFAEAAEHGGFGTAERQTAIMQQLSELNNTLHIIANSTNVKLR